MGSRKKDSLYSGGLTAKMGGGVKGGGGGGEKGAIHCTVQLFSI